MTFASIILAALGAVFLIVGAAKVADAPPLVAEFDRFGYPGWFRRATGGLEIAGAALLLGGLALDGLAIAGAAVLLCVMLGAIATHLRSGDAAPKLAAPCALLALLVTLFVVVA